MFVQKLRKLVQLAAGAGVQLRPAGVEQHIAQSQHQSARRGRGFELIDLRLQAGRLFRCQSRLLVGLIALAHGRLNIAVARGQHDLVPFRLSCRNPGVVGLRSRMHLRQPRVLRRHIRGLRDGRVVVMLSRVVGDCQILFGGIQVQGCVLVHIGIRFGRLNGGVGAFQRGVRLGSAGAGASASVRLIPVRILVFMTSPYWVDCVFRMDSLRRACMLASNSIAAL